MVLMKLGEQFSACRALHCYSIPSAPEHCLQKFDPLEDSSLSRISVCSPSFSLKFFQIKPLPLILTLTTRHTHAKINSQKLPLEMINRDTLL